jgi:hypothetical protein
MFSAAFAALRGDQSETAPEQSVLHFIALRCAALRCVSLRCFPMRCVSMRCAALRSDPIEAALAALSSKRIRA